MSNERSPREVCSITIGINGLMSGWLLATGGPQFRVGLGIFLVGRPDLLAGLRLFGRNALDLDGDPVESAREAHRLTLRLVDAGATSLLDHFLGVLEAIPERLVDLLVGHFDGELVGGGLEQGLAGHRRSSLLAQTRDQ